ncbi:MAG: hypothetical protein AAFW66_06075, partial [Pseudomonadota bacterium]
VAVWPAAPELRRNTSVPTQNREWIASIAPKGSNLEFTNVKATNLNLPNMVFMSVSFTSTAIFEGISRGTPGAIIQESPYEETPYYDPEFIPRVEPSKLTQFLESLNSRENWQKLRFGQMDWFKKETS